MDKKNKIKAVLWDLNCKEAFSRRQLSIITYLLNRNDFKINRGFIADRFQCSFATATRDITYLVKRNILIESKEKGPLKHYVLSKNFHVENKNLHKLAIKIFVPILIAS